MAAVIMCPPDVVAIICVPVSDSPGPTFVLFDSQPRVNHLQGPAFTFFPSFDSAGLYLEGLFGVGQQQTPPPTSYSAHFFVRKPIDDSSRLSELEAAYAVNIDLLRERFRANQADKEIARLLAENQRLKAEKRDVVESAQRELEEERQTALQMYPLIQNGTRKCCPSELFRV